MSGRTWCEIEGCDAPHSARGYCRKHYQRLLVHGDPLVDNTRRHVVRHGTVNEYNNYGCRCDECRRANSDAVREARHRRGACRPLALAKAERRAAAEARDNHGTETRYRLGCRCRTCRDAVAAARRRRRARVAA